MNPGIDVDVTDEYKDGEGWSYVGDVLHHGLENYSGIWIRLRE